MLEEILPDGEDTHGHESAWQVAGGRHVGRIWFGSSPDDPEMLYIWDLALDEEQRGQGIGGESLDAVVHLARTSGLSGVALTVFETNDAARRVYERKGFTSGTSQGGQVEMTLSWSS
jgi:ribosomal protein S18 acetylase RimI-like enzyme